MSVSIDDALDVSDIEGRKALTWILGVIVFLLLYRGDTGPHALINYLRLVPLANNMGLSGRWVIPLVFCFAGLAALGAQFLWDHIGKWDRDWRCRCWSWALPIVGWFVLRIIGISSMNTLKSRSHRNGSVSFGTTDPLVFKP